MVVEIMKRLEKKYLIDSSIYPKLQEKIAQVTDLDKYNKKKGAYTISNLYYDTSDNNLIRTSSSRPKPMYKEKLRIRSYGIPAENDKVFLEIKKKYNGVVSKRRTTFELSEAYEFIKNGYIEPKEYMNKQVLMELEHFVRLYNLSPKLYLAYDRLAYVGEKGLRITFDTDIRTRRHDLGLEKGDHGENLVDGDLCLMEIKVAGAIPLWLTKLLSEHEIYRQTFSKYGREFMKFIEGVQRNESA